MIKQNLKHPFIVIDDSTMDCMIVKKIITYSEQSSSITIFNNAAIALEYIRENASDAPTPHTIILLDIMMPVMDGFEFLSEFMEFTSDIRSKYKIFILSLSNNPYTRKRLAAYPVVEAIIEKPITIEKLTNVLRNQ